MIVLYLNHWKVNRLLSNKLRYMHVRLQRHGELMPSGGITVAYRVNVHYHDVWNVEYAFAVNPYGAMFILEVGDGNKKPIPNNYDKQLGRDIATSRLMGQPPIPVGMYGQLVIPRDIHRHGLLNILKEFAVQKYKDMKHKIPEDCSFN